MYTSPPDARRNGHANAREGGNGIAKSPKNKENFVHPWVSRFLAMKWFIAGGWVIGTLIGLRGTQAVFEDLSLMAKSPISTPTGKAQAYLQENIPGLMNMAPLITVIACETPCASVFGPFSMGVVDELDRLYRRLNNTYPGWIKSWDPPFYEGRIDPRISKDGQVMMHDSDWILPEHRQAEVMDLAKIVVKKLDNLNTEGRRLGFSVTSQGLPSMMLEMEEKLQPEINRNFAIIAPFLVALLIYMVQSWRLCLLSAVNLFMSTVLAFSTMGIWKQFGPQLSSSAPATIAFIGIAFSVDYSMFLFSRFREELQGGHIWEAALSSCLMQSGRVVALTGIIVLFFLLSMLLFPGELVQGMGIAGATMLGYCILTSLTFIPSAIAIFPGFFTYGLAVADGDAKPASRGSRFWFRLAVRMTEWPLIVVLPLAIYACMAPVAWQLTKLRPSSDTRAAMVEGPSKRSMELMIDHFGIGDALIVTLPGEGTIKSDEYFERGCQRVRDLMNETAGTKYPLRAKDFSGIMMVPGLVADQIPCPQPICLSWSQPAPRCPILPPTRDVLEGRGFWGVIGMDKAFEEAWSLMASADNTASVLMVAPEFDVTQGAPTDWVNLMRRLVPADTLFSATFMDYDMRVADYARFPWILAMEATVMFGVVSLVFGSMLAPLKLFLTVLLPLAFTFGVVTCIFQLGALDWMGSSHLDSRYGLYWMGPIMTVPLVFGIMLDYDLFLLARVRELRGRGFDDRAAIVGAMATVGPIISSAGLIMSVAFSGLILTSVRMQSEIGFALSFGVLVDTFVTRPLLVPAILMLKGRFNYWPYKMPEAIGSLDYLEEWLFEEDEK